MERNATNPTVVDPAFYQLIFTNDTVDNTDDVTYHPEVIEYDPAFALAPGFGAFCVNA